MRSLTEASGRLLGQEKIFGDILVPTEKKGALKSRVGRNARAKESSSRLCIGSNGDE